MNLSYQRLHCTKFPTTLHEVPYPVARLGLPLCTKGLPLCTMRDWFYMPAFPPVDVFCWGVVYHLLLCTIMEDLTLTKVMKKNGHFVFDLAEISYHIARAAGAEQQAV